MKPSPAWWCMAALVGLLLACSAPARLLTGARPGTLPDAAPLAPVSQPTSTVTPPPEAAASALAPTPVLPGRLPAALTSAGRAALPDFLSQATRYTIQVEIDFEHHAYQGRQQVLVTNTEAVALERLCFRLLPNGGKSYGNGHLDVSELRLDGQAMPVQLSAEDTLLTLPLSAGLLPGRSVRIEMAFSGQTPVEYGGGYGIYNQVDNQMTLASWYPILAVYDRQGWNLDPVSRIGDSVFSDIAFYTVTVTLPQDIRMAATGVAAATQRQAGRQTTQWVSGPVRDFTLALSPDFQVLTQPVGETTVQAFYLPDHEEAARQALAIAVGCVQVYQEKIGLYPYTELDIVETPLRYASGVEFPGLILISRSLFANPAQSSFVVTVAHEVAHQWWYNLVGNDVFDEPWQDEALTTYTSSLYLEFKIGGRAAEGLYADWQQRYERLTQEKQDQPVTETLEYYERQNDSGLYSGAVYNKGALFFKALRQEIGDAAFFRALQRYAATYAYRIATGQDLLHQFEVEAGRPLQALYRQWQVTPREK